MNKYSTYSDLFNGIKSDVDKSFDEISKEIANEWQDIVWKEFYLEYLPKSYNRTMQSLESISVLKINKNKSRIEISIGYDESKIETFQNGIWMAHEDSMPELIEYGGIYGHNENGTRALEKILNDIKSGELKKKFKEVMKSKGYYVL